MTNRLVSDDVILAEINSFNARNKRNTLNRPYRNEGETFMSFVLAGAELLAQDEKAIKQLKELSEGHDNVNCI